MSSAPASSGMIFVQRVVAVAVALRWNSTWYASVLNPSKTQPRPAIVSRPCSSLTASWHCTPAMIELIVGVVGVLPPSISGRVSRLHDRRICSSFQSRLGHRAFVARAVGA